MYKSTLDQWIFISYQTRKFASVPEKPEEEPVQVSRGEGSVSPTKSDVREFHDKIAKYKKEHKVVDEKWLENLVKEYNAKFSEDFHQYL